MVVKSIKDKINEYFYINPTAQLRVRQIEREVGVPLPSTIRYVKELVDEQILKCTVVAEVKLFSADRTSESFLIEKKMFNFKDLFFSGLVSYLIKELNNPVIVLFGSYSRGEDVEDSDIDLYIEADKNDLKMLKRFEKKLHRKIQLFFYKDIQDVENKELANNILNGMKVNGSVEVFK